MGNRDLDCPVFAVGKEILPVLFRSGENALLWLAGCWGYGGNAQTQDAMVATCAGVASLMGFALGIAGN